MLGAHKAPSVLVLNGFSGLAAPLHTRAAADVSPRWVSLDTPRPAVSRLAATPGVHPSGWAVAISTPLLGVAALGFAATAARARAGAPRMDLELGDTDAAPPSRVRRQLAISAACASVPLAAQPAAARIECTSASQCTEWTVLDTRPRRKPENGCGERYSNPQVQKTCQFWL